MCEVVAGQSPESKYYNEIGQGLPFYQGKTEFTAKYIGAPQKWTTQVTKIAPIGSIVMSVRAPVGPVNVVKNTEICIGRGLAAIICTEKINSEFLFYYLRSIENEIKGTNGAAFASINKAEIEKIKVPLPPIEKQKEIVAEIEQYQKIIDGAKQVVDNYEPIIKVNREWQEFSLGEICHILNGSTPSKTNDEFWNNGEIPWFTVDDIREQGRIINHTKKFISKTALKQTSVKLLPPKTVLLCCTASVGEYAITEIPLTTNQQFNGLIIKEEYKKIILPEYLFYYSVKFKEELQRLGGTTAFKFVSVKDVKTIKIKVPPIEEQNAIIEKMDFENKTIKTNKELIKIFKQKIKGTISQVWNNN